MAVPAFTREDLESALRGAQVGLWAWHFEADALRWSEETYRIYRIRPEGFAANTQALLDLIHPDDRDKARMAVTRAIADKSKDYYLEHRLATGSNEVVWVEARGRVILDDEGRVTGMTGTVVDASARRRNEVDVRDRARRYQLFSELATDYVYEASVDAARTNAVPLIVAGSFERIVGRTPQEVADMGGWFEIVHPDDLEGALSHMRELMEGRPVVQEYRILNARGEVRWLRDRILPVADPDTGALTTFLGGVTDITEQKELVEQLVQARKMEALARLAGGVAHDFNNLLTILFGELEVIKRRSEHALPEPPMASMHAALHRASELTRTLLTFGRKQVNKLKVVHLPTVVAEARPMLERAAGERVQVVVQEPPQRPLTVLVDPSEVQLVLINLVINARDAMPDGGTVHIALDARTLAANDPERPPELLPGEFVELVVRDEGVGIPGEILAHLFEPYFTTKGAGKGTGLGLAIAHGIVRRAGGAIVVKSAPEKGTRIGIYLPLSDAPAETMAQPAVRATVGGHERIILVEDEPSVCALLEAALRELGYDVRAAHSAEGVLAMPSDVTAATELLVTDVRLPGMDGIELARTLQEAAPKMKVLLISGYLGSHADEYERSGFALLPKPFTPEGLARKCFELLKGSGPIPS